MPQGKNLSNNETERERERERGEGRIKDNRKKLIIHYDLVAIK